MAHIVHICPRYLPARGGVELFFVKLSEALAARGDTVSVWTTDAATVSAFTSRPTRSLPLRPECINGVEVRRFPVRYLPWQRWTRTAVHILPFGTRWKCDTLRWTPWVPSMAHAASGTTERVDIVHAAGLPYSSLLFAGVRLADCTGARLIMSPFTHVPPPGRQGRRMRRAYLSPLNIRLLSRADRVFVQTDMERRILGEAGVPVGRQTVVGLGVDPAECTGGDRAGVRVAWGVADDLVVIGHLGNKSWDKGTVDLLEAAERLWASGLRFKLVLAGPEMASFRARRQRTRFKEHIVNLGELSDVERRDFFAGIDVFALPSYVESFGLSPLEAALNNAAVVAYNHGGPGQIFRHQVDALLAPVGDIGALSGLLLRVTTGAGERAKLAGTARLLATSYSWPRALDRVLTEYLKLLKTPQAR